MADLRKKMRTPYDASKFTGEGRGPGTISKELGLKSRFSGLYVFIKSGTPIYVGISRNVLARIRQHVTGKTQYDATLAYRMTKNGWKNEGQRKALMKDAGFLAAFDKAKAQIAGMSVAFVEADDPVTLYLLEVYAAVELDTSKWNSFRTH